MFSEAEPEKDKTPEPKPEEHIEEENKEEEKEPETQERKRPLRSERRENKQNEFMQRQWQEEREARIRLEEQVKALSEARKLPADPDIKRLLTEVKDPEEATQIFQDLIARAGQQAEERAVERFRQVQAEENAEVDAIRDTIEESLEDIEDTYGADFSNAKTRNAFLDFVEKIAPQDSDDLPNMRSAWEIFQSTQKAPTANTERKAAISTRSMTRPTQAVPEGKNLQRLTFDSINRGSWFDKIIGNKG